MKTSKRNSRQIRIWLLLVAVGAMLSLACSSITGGGEIGNPKTIIGKIVDKNNHGISGMRVCLLNTYEFNPVAASIEDTSGKPFAMTHPLAEAMTDSNGNYRVKMTMNQGTYHIFGQSADTAVMIYHKISFEDSIQNIPLLDTANTPGSAIVGITDSLFTPGGYVYVAGSYLFTKIDSIGRKTIRCPIGAVIVAYYSTAHDSIIFTIPSNALVNRLNGISVTSGLSEDWSALMHHISQPMQPAGDTLVHLSSQINGTIYMTGLASSNLKDSIQYCLFWGDSSFSPWILALQTRTTSIKFWSSAGTYSVRAKARSNKDTTVVSVFSDPLMVTVLP